MKNPWRFFLVVEALLLLYALWQIFNSPPLFMLLIFGILCLYFASRAQRRGQRTNFRLVVGCLAVFISLLNNPAVWLMLVFGVLFIGLKGVELTGIDPTKNAFWKKKQIIIVETEAPGLHPTKKERQNLFGNERIGNQVFEWDDININMISGDTIIDLGNTILPKKDNIIMVRKGFGRTRILVPVGIGIALEHSGFIGNMAFIGEQTPLRSEKITVYSEDYDTSERRIKILSSTLMGDVEVIRV